MTRFDASPPAEVRALDDGRIEIVASPGLEFGPASDTRNSKLISVSRSLPVGAGRLCGASIGKAVKLDAVVAPVGGTWMDRAPSAVTTLPPVSGSMTTETGAISRFC